MPDTKTEEEVPEGYRRAVDGTLRCRPGTKVKPHRCEWHAGHYWCDFCLGYYGVPHEEEMHRGPTQHPLGCSDVRSCACRFCEEEVVRLELLSEVQALRSKALDLEGVKAAAVSAYWDFEFLLESKNLLGVTTGIERLSNSMSDLSSWVMNEIEELRAQDV